MPLMYLHKGPIKGLMLRMVMIWLLTIFILSLKFWARNFHTRSTQRKTFRRDVIYENNDELLSAARNYKHDSAEIMKADQVKRTNEGMTNMTKDASDEREDERYSKIDQYNNTNDGTSIQQQNKWLKFYPDDAADIFPVTAGESPYIIANEDACKGITDLTFIVIVTSAATKFSLRYNIRHTWGNVTYHKNHKVKVVFMLGIPRRIWYQKPIEYESKVNGDIVQGNFVDSYANLTQKSVLGIRWVTEHCPSSKMVVKVDDDAVINMFQLLEVFDRLTAKHNFSRSMLCHVRPEGSSRIFRNVENKWYTGDTWFPNMKTYPFEYCDGFFTLITPDALPILFEVATQTPYFWIEDVYLTGILPAKARDVKHIYLDGIDFYGEDTYGCLKLYARECTTIVSLTENAKMLRTIWSEILKHFWK